MDFYREPHVSGGPLLVGRFIFGGFFLYSGLHHYLDAPVLTAAAAAHGTPFPELAVLGTGALLIVGGASLIAGIKPRIGALCIMIFLAGVTPVMHAFWADPPGPQRMNDLGNFTKNIALFGGACVCAAIPEPWPMSLIHRHLTPTRPSMPAHQMR